MTVIPFPRQPAAPVTPWLPFWPDRTVQVLQSGKFGEVLTSDAERVVVALYDRTTMTAAPYELRPVPMPPAVAVVIGGRA